jgi:hypothetical protein
LYQQTETIMRAIEQLLETYKELSLTYNKSGDADLIDIRLGIHKAILILCSDDSITSDEFTEITNELDKYRNNG